MSEERQEEWRREMEWMGRYWCKHCGETFEFRTESVEHEADCPKANYWTARLE